MKKPLISVVLGSYNRLSFLKLTIESVRAELMLFQDKQEIIVVDGGSDDGTLEWLCAQKDIITIVQHNRGTWENKPITRRSWGYFMNLGFKAAQAKYICMISDDCLLLPGALINGYNAFEKALARGEKVGAMAFYWRNCDQEKNNFHVNCVFNDKMYVNHGLYLRSALDEVHYIEEDRYLFYAADVDLCLKLLHYGYACIASENSYIEHYPLANLAVRKTNHDLLTEDHNKFLQYWVEIYGDKNEPDLHHHMSIEKQYDGARSVSSEKFKNINRFNPAVIALKSRTSLRQGKEAVRNVARKFYNLVKNR